MKDPYEMINMAGSPTHAQVEAQLRSLYLSLRGCAGAACNVPVPATLG